MKTPNIHPYLFFGGRCEEAFEFYKGVFGAQIHMAKRFSESEDPIPESVTNSNYEEKIMHAEFTVKGQRIMASDGCGPSELEFKGFSLFLILDDEKEIHRLQSALAKAGKEICAPAKTSWSECFSMVEDKFGMSWMFSLPYE